MLKRLGYLLVEESVIFLEIIATLGMSDDNIFHTRIHEHCRRDLACERALFLDIHILSADFHVCALNCLHNRNDIDRRHAVYDVNIIRLYQIL